MWVTYFYFDCFFKFICLVWKRAKAGEGQRVKERERIPSRLCTVLPEADVGLEFPNCEVVT